MSKQVAQTILQQLGGNRFIAMTGAKNFSCTANSLLFKIGGGAKNRINFVNIKLNAADLYDVEFGRVRGIDITQVEAVENVYADNLCRVFTDATGFDTRF